MAQASHKVDYVVIGADLTGLLVAQELSAQGAKVVLTDESETPCQRLRAIKNEFGSLSPLMNCFPQTPGSQAPADFLETRLHMKIFRPDQPMIPMTYVDGALREFIGFGDQQLLFYSELLPYLSANYYQLTLDFEQVIQQLWEQKTYEYVPRSVVTKFELEGPQIVGATINGHKKLQAENYIYTQNLKSLSTLLKDFPIATKLKNKLSKGPYLSMLRVDLFFNSPLCEMNSLHILNGTTQDEIGPCFGLFHPPTDAGQSSQWLTFLDAQEAEESEFVGEAIRKIKRQIKRAYPTSSEVLKKERISLYPYEAGADEQFLPQHKFNEVNNLWVAHPQLNAEKGPFAAIAQAQLLLQKMGFEKADHQHETSQQAVPDLGLE